MTDEIPFQFIPEVDIQQAVVECEDRPERPHGDEFVARGLTDSVWEIIESSLAQQKSDRPAFTEVAARLRPLILCGMILFFSYFDGPDETGAVMKVSPML